MGQLYLLGTAEDMQEFGGLGEAGILPNPLDQAAEVAAIRADLANPVTRLTFHPAPPAPAVPTWGDKITGFLSTLTGGINQIGQTGVQVIDATARARQAAALQQAQMQAAINRLQNPSWFDQEMIPGLKNSALVAIAGGALALVFLMGNKTNRPA